MAITEADVLRVHEHLVRTIAAQARSLERDEALALARIGLLKAIRTWRAGQGSFQAYAAQRMRQELALFKQCVNRQQRAESTVSLDARIKADRSDATLGDILAIVEADQTVIDVAMFIRALPPEERMFVRLRMRGYDNCEIARLLLMNHTEIEKLHGRVMGQAVTYFELGKGGQAG